MSTLLSSSHRRCAWTSIVFVTATFHQNRLRSSRGHLCLNATARARAWCSCQKEGVFLRPQRRRVDFRGKRDNWKCVASNHTSPSVSCSSWGHCFQSVVKRICLLHVALCSVHTLPKHTFHGVRLLRVSCWSLVMDDCRSSHRNAPLQI